MGKKPYIQFEEEEALLESWMEEAQVEPSEKFQGAPLLPKRFARRKAAPDLARLEPDGVLDLHGQLRDEALRLVKGFVQGGYSRGWRHLLIITGKGLNSGPQGPVLGPAVEDWLSGEGRTWVASHQPAPPRHGGQGARWVTLIR